MSTFTGKIWVLGDDIDTDIIIPTEYLALKTVDDMKKYAFSPLRPDWPDRFSRVISLSPARTSAAVLPVTGAGDYPSSGRCLCDCEKLCPIFFRNSINNGLLLIESTLR